MLELDVEIPPRALPEDASVKQPSYAYVPIIAGIEGATRTVGAPMEKMDSLYASPHVWLELAAQDIPQAASTRGPLTDAAR